METKRAWSNIFPSKIAKNTVSPIRCLVENLKVDPNPNKSVISLALGDPTTFGNLQTCKEVTTAVNKSLMSMQFNGYAATIGHIEAREAVARYNFKEEAPLCSEDVILTNGCSHALEICILALADTYQNILIPRPGFPHYRTLAEGFGIQCRTYDLNPDADWQVDLDSMESQIDEKTAAIIINNPSNPCGSVFTKEHLEEILDIAEKYSVPIIADEIYSDFVFKGEKFYPISTLTNEVPILTCSSLSKRFLVPGWRFGWILINDRKNRFGRKIRCGLQAVARRVAGVNTLLQGALPDILDKTPQSFFSDTIESVEKNAIMAYSALKDVPGLRPIMPKGSMYMMVAIEKTAFPNMKQDIDFVERLLTEESVLCLPGKCFDYPNYFRIILTVPGDIMIEACERIKDFCTNHYSMKNCGEDVSDFQELNSEVLTY